MWNDENNNGMKLRRLAGVSSVMMEVIGLIELVMEAMMEKLLLGVDTMKLYRE